MNSLQHYAASDTVEFDTVQHADEVVVTIVEKVDDTMHVYLEIDIIACIECKFG